MNGATQISNKLNHTLNKLLPNAAVCGDGIHQTRQSVAPQSQVNGSQVKLHVRRSFPLVALEVKHEAPEISVNSKGKSKYKLEGHQRLYYTRKCVDSFFKISNDNLAIAKKLVKTVPNMR
jgi:hypothetical protein